MRQLDECILPASFAKPSRPAFSSAAQPLSLRTMVYDLLFHWSASTDFSRTIDSTPILLSKMAVKRPEGPPPEITTLGFVMGRPGLAMRWWDWWDASILKHETDDDLYILRDHNCDLVICDVRSVGDRVRVFRFFRKIFSVLRIRPNNNHEILLPRPSVLLEDSPESKTPLTLTTASAYPITSTTNNSSQSTLINYCCR